MTAFDRAQLLKLELEAEKPSLNELSPTIFIAGTAVVGLFIVLTLIFMFAGPETLASKFGQTLDECVQEVRSNAKSTPIDLARKICQYPLSMLPKDLWRLK